MKIRVVYTIDVPAGSLEALRELACVDTNAEAADFVRADAEEYTRQYLEGAGVRLLAAG